MTSPIPAPELILGVVGAGLMGRGIAQVAAEAGIQVILTDQSPEAVAEALQFCADMLRRKATKGTLSLAEAEAAIGRIVAAGVGSGTAFAGFSACDVVIEAVAESLDVKHRVMDCLEAVVRDDCVLATNTSSLSVTAIAAKARRPQRIAGFHFFNPVPLMRLVEVIGGARTDEDALVRLTALANRMGHLPVRATDTPGFLVNHAGRGFGTEALRIASEGIASFADIDRVMTDSAGFRMGPFELFDLTGLDVSSLVMESIYRQYYDEPRYRPNALTTQRVAAGLYGRKSGGGFYTYRDGKAEKPAELSVAPVEGAPAVWVSGRFPDVAGDLRDRLARAGATVETTPRPSDEAVIMLTPFGEDTTTASLAEGLDPTRSVAVDCLLGLDRRRTLMRTPVTKPAVLFTAQALLAADGTPVTVIHDSPGFIAQRIVACIVNIGADIAQQRIGAPEDINRATEIALGYPRGSLRFGDELGPRRILDILAACHAFYGDPRYRASPWLKRRAMLGVPLTTPEG
ncbi:3-hydroxyacyl-CoA dehydrogenase [Microvirga antarctica]|uniref:3-hydroxyacyl-CoA dehydrogenase n=1 Tax=Microvirga antarctica TaxID=2819233 RepID=UPI001B314C26|nr:3-hydroxyacyl-CoA dehydrogenase [Microvirga antarctica]